MAQPNGAVVPYWRTLEWAQLEAAYPPPPTYHTRIGRASAAERRALQEKRFLDRVADAWSVPFYRQRWSAAGLAPGDVTGLDDITSIPTFTSEDLTDSVDNTPPFGNHQWLPKGPGDPPIAKIGTSGGTRGVPRVLLFDPSAWEVQGIGGARALWAQGAGAGDLIQDTYTCALANAGWMGYHACRWLGAIPVTTGSGAVTASERQLETAKDWGTTVWFSHGEYLLRLAAVAEERSFDLHQLPTKFLHSYLGPNAQVVAAHLEAAWGCPVFDNYGTNELGLVAFECQARDGLHVLDDLTFVELAGTSEGPEGAGNGGNLIATSLHRSVPPIIRYDMQDRFAWQGASECGCGLQSPRLSHFLGRSDEMVKLRGQNVWPRACQLPLLGHPLTTGEFLCVVRTEGEGLHAATAMTVRVERAAQTVDEAALGREFERTFKQILGVTVGVEIVDPGSLSPFTGQGREGKVKRLLDLR